MANVVTRSDAGEGTTISTGQADLDKKLGGGIPKGSLTLVEGQSGAGKSVVTQQMIWGSLADGATVTLYTSENTVKSFIRQMNSLSLDIINYLLLGRLRIYPINAGRLGLTPAHVFTSIIRSMKEGPPADLMVIDSLTTFVTKTSWEDTSTFFEECKAICGRNRTIINVTASYAFDATTLARLRSMCDAHLTLRVEEVGEQLMKILEIGKVRGASKTTGNIVTFDVEPELGMKIIPISKAAA